MRPYAQKILFYSDTQKVYDTEEEKAKMEAEVYMIVLQQLLLWEKRAESEGILRNFSQTELPVLYAATSLDNLRRTVRTEWVNAMNEWANEKIYH